MSEHRGSQVTAVLSALEESSILGKEALEGLASAILAAGISTREEAASFLVREGHLSGFQGEQLLAGRIDECVLSGRYHVLDRLGAGGMGAVYRAVDRKLDRIVAVKVLPPERLQDPGAVARFEREARALARLSHPGIVQAYDSGADRGRHFLVMEHVEGTNLRNLIRKDGRLAPTTAADYLYQAARALEHAHARGLVHRDLKPSNLLVTAAGEVKILDLGLARFLQDQISDSRLTLEGMGMGTSDYMAPEQFRSARSADERSDIYALGCTLHEALSGIFPFPGSSLEEKARAHAEAEPRPLEEACPDCPSGLLLAARRMMAKRPEERFRTARDAAEALAPYVSGSSSSFAAIRAEASWEGSRLAISLAARRRGRRLALGGAAVALLLAAGLAAYGLLPWREDRARTPSPEAARAAPAAAEPGVILVAAGGSGHHRTIGEALAAARPGATIRVIDGATYRESLGIRRSDLHEGVTIEATKDAIVEPVGTWAIQIENVPRVTLRGFRLRGFQGTLITAAGHAHGTVLEDLRFEAGPGAAYRGMSLESLKSEGDDPPVIVRRCTIREANVAIRISGVENNYLTPNPCGRIAIHDNLIEGCRAGIVALGSVHGLLVAGNRIAGSALYGIQLENLLEGAGDILIANNTVLSSRFGLRLWDSHASPQGIEVRGNLILGSSGPEVAYIDSGNDPVSFRGPGDAAALLGAWRWGRNWREGSPPTGDDIEARSWVPAAPDDVLRERIDVVSRDPKATGYLRPPPGSPLATGGAGQDDPSLPPYAGAVPPDGVEPWDWGNAWEAWSARWAKR